MSEAPTATVVRGTENEAVKADSLIDQADGLIAAGDRKSALWAYREALAIYERLAVADSGKIPRPFGVAISHQRIAFTLQEGGDRKGALAALRVSFTLFEKLAATDPRNGELQRVLAQTREDIADLVAAEGGRKDALAIYRAASAVYKKLAAAARGNPKPKISLAKSQFRIGDALTADGDRKGALAAYRKSYAICKKLSAADPSNTQWKWELALNNERIAGMLAAGDHWGEHQKALAAHRAALALRRELVATDPGNATWRCALANSLSSIGQMLFKGIGDREEAFTAYREFSRHSGETRARRA